MPAMNLAQVLDAWRRADGVTVREAAQRIGIDRSTFNRIERGYPMDGHTLAAILRWLLAEP